MLSAFIIYLALGILFGEACNRTFKRDEGRQLSLMSHLWIVLGWPFWILWVIFKE